VVDPETGEVDRNSLVRGYGIEKDRYLLLTKEEIRSVRLESTETIDIERFVDGATIDRIWWNEPYYLAPDGQAGLDAYIVIRDAHGEIGEGCIGPGGDRHARTSGRDRAARPWNARDHVAHT
jgi:DNA end-binding protein Ku